MSPFINTVNELGFIRIRTDNAGSNSGNALFVQAEKFE